MSNQHLNGWKEIGAYLGRTARTAQRWEAQLGMPVHRPAKRKRTVVVGFPHDLDAWLTRNRSRLESEESYEQPESATDLAALDQKLSRLQSEAAQLALALERARGEITHVPPTRPQEMAALLDGPD
jgi:hypothetical protein